MATLGVRVDDLYYDRVATAARKAGIRVSDYIKGARLTQCWSAAQRKNQTNWRCAYRYPRRMLTGTGKCNVWRAKEAS